jgi:hypothetical protein
LSSSKATAASKSSEKSRKVEIIEEAPENWFLSYLISWASPPTTKYEPITKEEETEQINPSPVTDTAFHRDPELDDDELSKAIATSIKTKGMDEDLVPIIRELAGMKLSQASVIAAPNAERIVYKAPPQPGLLQFLASCSCIPAQTKKPAMRRFPGKDKRNQRPGAYDFDYDNDDDYNDDNTRQSDGSFTRYSDGSVAFSSVYSESVYEDVSVDDDTRDGGFSVGDNSTNMYSVGDESTGVFSNLGSTVAEDEYTADYSSDDDESFSYYGSDEEDDWEVISVFELPVVDAGSVKRSEHKGSNRRNATQQSKHKKQRQPRSQQPPMARLYTLEEEDVSSNNEDDDYESSDEKETDFETLMEPIEDARAVKDALAIVKQHAKRLGIDEKELLKAFDYAETNDYSVY